MNRIFDDDPDAIEQLTIKLDKLLAEKAHWKAIKPEKRDYGHNETDGMKRWYMLQNLNGTIFTIRKRIKKLQDRDAAGLCVVRKATYPDGKKHFYYQEVKKET